MEQLYPFPSISLTSELKKYPNAEVVWCQEEPQNMGAWTFVDRRIEALLVELHGISKRPTYIGRNESASPATGSSRIHAQQQSNLVEQALTLD
jgi:2-oxoglutarate dehydrogenase E1 component